MISASRKLQVIEEVLKIDNEALLAEIEVLLKGFSAIKEKADFSAKYRGALKLSEEQRQDLQKHLKDIRDEWERGI